MFCRIPLVLVLATLVEAAVLSPTAVLSKKKPNILFVLTDDQDQLLGSMDPDGPCQTILKHVGTAGATFKNAFVNTPICCPSRAEIQTGRLMHNTKVLDNKCGGMDFVNGAEKLNVAASLKAHDAEYATFYAGKYLNNYASKDVGGVKRVPPGWDQWYGLVGNSKYYDYTVSNNGVAEKHGSDYADDYFTDRVANRSLEFMSHALRKGKPFFMMVATPASHEPNTPAPQYAETYAGRKAPRLPSYNVTGQHDKHYLLREIIPLDEGHANVSDVFFQRRLSVLRSVDDMVSRFVDKLQAAGEYNNTYFIYTSDHGYHLGEFGMLYDKRMLYETDIRIPLLVKGPGITSGQMVELPATHIDLAPTILDMAGLRKKPTQMDGRSWLPLVTGSRDIAWRNEFMVEYSGGNPLPNGGLSMQQGAMPTGQCSDDLEAEANAFAASLPTRTSSCSANAADELSIKGKCSCSIGRISGDEHDISPCDGKNNTYACYRTYVPGKDNKMYCEFNDPEHFVEYYDLSSDPYNLKNLASVTSKQELQAMHKRLMEHQACHGDSCFDPSPGLRQRGRAGAGTQPAEQ